MSAAAGGPIAIAVTANTQPDPIEAKAMRRYSLTGEANGLRWGSSSFVFTWGCLRQSPTSALVRIGSGRGRRLVTMGG